MFGPRWKRLATVTVGSCDEGGPSSGTPEAETRLLRLNGGGPQQTVDLPRFLAELPDLEEHEGA